MILKNMLAFCKKSKLIKIMYFGDMKYLSDGFMAAYIGNAAPEWEAKDCAIALDLSEDEQEKYTLIDEYVHEHEPVHRDNLEKVEGRIIGMIDPIKTNLEFMNDFASNLSIGVKNSLEKRFCDAGAQISITDM